MITLPPFKAFLASNIPSVYDNTLSYYDELTKLIAYLEQQVVPAVNENTAGLKLLKDYVENYFKNLDVQEEINNKLDEMAESGVLQEIIAAYLEISSLLTFDTIAELKAATNIVDGSTCLAIGELAFNDGKFAYYKIREKQPDDVVDEDTIISLSISNELVGEKIDNIKFKQLSDLISALRDETLNPPADLCKAECKWSYSTSSYYAMLKLPRSKFSFTIIPYATYGYDGAYKYVENNPKSICINGQLSSPTVVDGVVTVENPSPSDEYWYFFGIDSDGNPKYTKDVHRTLSGTDLLALDYKQAFGVWSPIVINGTNFNASTELDTTDPNYSYIIEQAQPRSILGYDDDYWYLIVVEGRLPRSKGTTLAGTQTLMAELNIPNAFNMDGGSNTQLWISNPTTNLGIRDNSRYPRGYTSNNTYSLIKFTEIGE